MSPKKTPAKPAPRRRLPARDNSSSSLEARAAEVRRGPGRPVDPNLPRAKVWFRVDEEELAAWNAAAERAGHNVGAWLRHVANTAARR